MFDEAGLPHAPRTKMPNSRAALNVAELARERGVHKPFHERLMTAFWGEDRDISDPDVLAEEGEKFGLDPDEVRDVARTHRYQDRVQASTQAVMEAGANGVPAFVVADRVLIPGAQPHSLFEKVMQKLEFESVDNTDATGAGES
jgi:predicted DsbA family dithiol-disulfide isomerase